MRGSRNEPRQDLAAALGALLLLASAPPTRAQVGSPVPLIAQAPAAPAAPAPAVPAAPAEAPSATPDESIQATPLAPGDADGALALIDALPTTMSSEDLDRDRVELRFAKDDTEGACRDVQSGIGRHQGVWWDRALIACQALAGDQAKASLGLGLLREQQAPPDPAFDTLVTVLGGHPAKLDKVPDAHPVLIKLLAAAKLLLPADAVASADLLSLRAWASNDAVPPLQRLAAAERAATLGALPPQALAALYGKVEFKPEELGTAIKQGKAPASPRERALLYRVARSDPAASVRTAALANLLGDAKKRGAFITMAQVVAPILGELTPSDELASFAPDAVRAMYAAGRAGAAQAWLAHVDGAAMPDLAVWTRQQEAANGKRVGETVLLTLLLARAGDHLSGEPIVLSRAVAGLKAVGLESEARALALEAALAAGL